MVRWEELLGNFFAGKLNSNSDRPAILYGRIK